MQLMDVCMTEDFGGDWGKCNLRLEYVNDRKKLTIPVTPNKNYTKLTCDNSSQLEAILYSFETNERFNVHHFLLENLYLTRN